MKIEGKLIVVCSNWLKLVLPVSRPRQLQQREPTTWPSHLDAAMTRSRELARSVVESECHNAG